MKHKTRKTAVKPTGIKLPRSIRRLFPQVTNVRDAGRGVHVAVTQKDSDGGKRMKASECALAIAAKREFEADGVIIGMSVSYLIKGDTAIRYRTPASVSRELVSFDRHHDFAPGTYALAAVAPSQRFGVQYERRPGKDHPSRSRINRIVHKETVRVRVLEHGAEG
ncbi:MAG TPA: hypothetical protein VK531_00815 [Gemmatimonadales bacterium]|nr:hypothetical protein [Gemmatimonadales bacterium]